MEWAVSEIIKQKWDLNCEGHKAVADLYINDNKTFTGKLAVESIGTGTIFDGTIIGDENNILEADISLGGYGATFHAVIIANKISGVIKGPLFFKKDFTGDLLS